MGSRSSSLVPLLAALMSGAGGAAASAPKYTAPGVKPEDADFSAQPTDDDIRAAVLKDRPADYPEAAGEKIVKHVIRHSREGLIEWARRKSDGAWLHRLKPGITPDEIEGCMLLEAMYMALINTALASLDAETDLGPGTLSDPKLS